MSNRKIIHIDMDYFYAQVEEIENPFLKDKPFAIGGEQSERGVISTCNYIARSYGVRSAMPTKKALQLCSDLIVLPTNMSKYKSISQDIRRVFYSITDLVEPLSLDEAYLDVSSVNIHKNSATLIAEQIRKSIYESTGLTASAGVGPNKLLAKIASDINKPNGICVISPKEVSEFMLKLPVKKLFGVGKVTQERLAKLGIDSCDQLQKLSKDELYDKFGKLGISMYGYCRGIDNREVNPVRIRKSVSVEQTFSVDLTDLDSCIQKIPALYSDFLNRVNADHVARISGVFVKITDHKFGKHSIERQTYLYDLGVFTMLFSELYQKHNLPVRLIGIGIRLNEKENRQIPLYGFS